MARLLVVDDEPDLRELLRVCLSMAGHDVAVAADGRRGLEMAVALRPDAIVLDVMMPGLDGWSVIGALKSDPDPAVSAIPIILLTARADDLDLVRGGIEGAVRYLTKPFALNDLTGAVSEAVGGPEPEQRQAAQRAALARLARLERGVGQPAQRAPRPRISRLEPVTAANGGPGAPLVADQWPRWLDPDRLSDRDHEVLHVLLTSAGMTEARERLDVSRSYLYARLRNLAAKLDFQSGPSLLQALRAAKAARERGR